MTPSISRLLPPILLALLAPAQAIAHSPAAPGEVWSAWELDPLLLLAIGVPAILYARGVRRVWRRAGHGRGVSTRAAACFAAGMIVLALALVSPLHAFGEFSFAGHMTQHVALMLIATPLIAFGAPATGTLWGLPRPARRALGRAAVALRVHTLWRALTQPLNAWLLHAVALWLWHAPALYQATLTSESVHAVQHASFVATGIVFWAAAGIAIQRGAAGIAVLYLFTTSVHESLLGALLTFSTVAWYPEYAARLAPWGVGILSDQQLGGLLMWIPGGLVYVVAALAAFALWIRESAPAPATLTQRAS